MDLVTPSLIASLAWYTTIAVVAARRREAQGEEVDWLAVYSASAGLWSLIQFGALWGWFAPPRTDVALHVPLYAALVLGGLLLHLTRAFLRVTGAGWVWWGTLAGWLVVGFLLDVNVFNLPDLINVGLGTDVVRVGAIRVFLVAGWGLMMGGAAWMTLRVFQRAQQPLHRNRIAYWAPVLVITALGDGMLFAQRIVVGTSLYMLATGLAAYALLIHHLPDVRQAARAALTYLLTVALAAGAYGVGFSILQVSLRTAPENFLIGAGTALAVGIAILFSPLLRQVRSLVNRLIARVDYDPGRTVREYSISISNILDVKQLARVSLGILRDELGVKQGALLLVDRRKDEGGETFALRSVGELGSAVMAEGHLSIESPVAEYLYKEYRPLTQYDIDLLPRFRELNEAERAWLTSLAADVYVPIYSKGSWIGLFALGTKASGDRYFNEDLNLLSTLADQTTVALENARLVENLVQLNRNLREAYTALDQANQRLEHLDRAKSDFIAVLSHELRTPMGILLGYSQLLADDPQFKSRPNNQPIVDGLSKGAVRLQEIIETMLDMAMIDNRTLRLVHKPVPILPVLQALNSQFMTALADRELTLTLEEGLARLPKIEADTETLGKAFYHLIINAIKYTPNGGRLTLSGQVLEPGHARLAKGGIEVVVSDTGIGIDPKDQDLIFTKFYQTGEVALHSTGKTKFKGGGPGLGLAIARGIVEAHGGQIWVESPGYDEVNCPGSRFHVALPLRQPDIVKVEALTDGRSLRKLTV
jgi:signal transduction histidine kinase